MKELESKDVAISTFEAGPAFLPTIEVTVTHLPTGLRAVCDKHRSRLRNTEEALQELRGLVESHITRGAPTTDKNFLGHFGRGDTVYRRDDIGSPIHHGSVVRVAYDTEGEPLVIVNWPHKGTYVEAPEDLRIADASN